MLADEQEAETGPEENSLGKGIMSMQYRKSNIFGIRVVLALVIILAMASFALVGCGDDEVATDETEGTTVEDTSAGTESTDGASAEAPENVPDEPLKIGLLVARSGVTAPVGEAAHRAVEWWAERVNADGGILGRQVELLVEEESNPQDTVDRMRKLVLEDEVSAVLGLISTGVSLATAPIAEELETPLLMWDGTTQDGVEETMPDPAYTFRSTDNETEAIAAAVLTAKYFPDTKRIVGIANDYSYGHDTWNTYQAVLSKYMPDVEFVDALFPELGATEFASHITAIQQSGADLLFNSFWSGDAPVFMKQAAAVNLFDDMNAVFTTAGGVHTSLEQDFVPEGMLLGYNTFYFDMPEKSDLLEEFLADYQEAYGDYPMYEANNAYFTAVAYKAAVEAAYEEAGEWPSNEQVAEALVGIEVESLSGMMHYDDSKRMQGDFFQGITVHSEDYSFATIDPVEQLSTTDIMKPTADTDLLQWIDESFPKEGLVE